MNDENLVPVSKRTKNEAREISQKGGINSGIARRNKKALRETTELLLSLPLKKGKVTKDEKIKAIEDLSKGNPTTATLIIAKQIQMAIKGNTKSVELITKLLGDEPKEQEAVSSDVTETNFIEDLQDRLNEREVEGVDDNEDANDC